MFKKIWLLIGIILVIGLGVAFWTSPFVHSSGPFAQFAKARAIPAGIIGLLGSLILMIWGWILLKRKRD